MQRLVCQAAYYWHTAGAVYCTKNRQ